MATSAEFVAQLKKDIQAFPTVRIKHPCEVSNIWTATRFCSPAV